MKKTETGKTVGVAISGGVDSVVLLHVLKSRLQAGEQLVAVHCEHGIRGEESRSDMQFLQTLCKEWEIPLYLFQEDCPARAEREKVSLETAARNFRYECFSILLREGKADRIATAHHQNDEAETVLFRLARGTALAGARGIRPQNGKYIRPLLAYSKGEILAYATAHGLSYREDSTNLQTDATRNKLRLEILPKLEEAIGGATKNLARFAERAAEDDELLYALSDGLLYEEEGKPAVAFSEKKPLFTRACLTALKGLGVEKDYTSAHLHGLFELQGAQRGAFCVLPCDFRAKKGKKGIVFFRAEEENFPPLPDEKPFLAEDFDGGRYAVKVFSTSPAAKESGWRVLRVDKDKIPDTAVFRFRKEGDTIKRFGGGRKSLKKFFNEEEIPPAKRAYLPLIAEREGGEVYAVCGVEISEQVKVDGGTKHILYIALTEND